jgi:hypothetical protein
MLWVWIWRFTGYDAWNGRADEYLERQQGGATARRSNSTIIIFFFFNIIIAILSVLPISLFIPFPYTEPSTTTAREGETRRAGYLYILPPLFPFVSLSFLLWGKHRPPGFDGRTTTVVSNPINDIFSRVTPKISSYTASAEASGTVPRCKKAKRG